MRSRLQLLGHKFGQLTVIADGGSDTRGRSRWVCACACGKQRIVSGLNLRSGDTRSCGCYKSAVTARRSTKHGEALKTKEYKAWAGMLSRCANRRGADWGSYGGRGITVCQSWKKSYAAFLNDLGRKPDSSYSLDRIDNEGNYEPSNCRWATASQQNKNRRAFNRGEL